MTAHSPSTPDRPHTAHWLATRLDEMLAARPAGVHPIHAAIGLLMLMAYGAAMGSFGVWMGGDDWLQIIFSAVKVPLLLGATFALSLPSFFVFNALAGLAGDFREVMRTLIATQSALSALLGSLMPLTLLWYTSGDNYLVAVLFNAAMFGMASIGILPVVRRNYRALVLRNPMHRRMAVLWICIYAFIGIQMGWTLRPFIGDPNNTAEFFRSNGWGNAYVIIFEIITQALNHTPFAPSR